MTYRIRAYPVDLLRRRAIEIVGIAGSDTAEYEARRLRVQMDEAGKAVYRQVIVEVESDGSERSTLD